MTAKEGWCYTLNINPPQADLDYSNAMKNPVTALTTYVRESVAELYKVTWPTREETKNYTLLVLGLSIFVAIFFSALDLQLNKLLEFIL